MTRKISGILAAIALSLGLLATTGVLAQGQQTLSSTMKIYVFPTDGQNAEQQSRDEAECYTWAVGNTGTDPFDLAAQAQQQAGQAAAAAEQAKNVGKGAGAQGAVKGAAAGALIGAIAGDTGKGAAYGAAAGVVRGRRKGRQAQSSAEKQAEQQAAQAKAANEAAMGNFKKAFSVCLEAKKYMVK